MSKKNTEFQILCATMKQSGFENISKMNVHSDILYANQNGKLNYQKEYYDGFTAEMISTNTKGVGVNRNIALLNASGEICLLADDDVRYVDNVKEIILSEFQKYPQADIFIFQFNSDDKDREIRGYKRTRKKYPIERMPWGGIQIAFRLASVKKANVWFTTLFGGGCIFPSGEDSMWLQEVVKKGLKIYISNKTIGSVSFNKSTWFTGFDEKYYWGKGAAYQASHPKLFFLYMLYMCVRSRKFDNISSLKKMKYMIQGRRTYLNYEII